MSELDKITKAVENRLKQAQVNKEFKDSEKRVYGTRKELMALKLIRLSDLDSLEQNENLAQELIKKDKVFPKLNVDSEIDKGVSGGTAYLKFRLRQLYPAKPLNSKVYRMLYVGMADAIVKHFWDEVSIDGFEKRVEDFAPILAMNQVLFPDDYEELEAEYRKQKSAFKKFNDWQYNYRSGNQNYPEDVQWWSYYQKQEYDEKMYEEKRKELGIIEADKSIIFAKYQIDIPRSSYKTYYMTYVDNVLGKLLRDTLGDALYHFLVQKYNSGFGNSYELAVKFEPYTQAQFDDSREKRRIERLTEEVEQYKEFASKYDTLTDIEYGKEYFEKLLKKDEPLAIRLKSIAFYNQYDKEYVRFENMQEIGLPPSLYSWWLSKAKDYLAGKVVELEKEIDALKEATQLHGNLYTFAKREKKEDEDKTERSDIQINKGIPLSYIKRTGGFEIIDDDVKVETITDEFGFASVTFGNYVKDKEAREHIRHFLGAVSDLAEMLNMDLKELNRLHKKNNLGGLSMWFGAGGRGGKASAFYMGAGCVINLTKSRGDGTVAHEFAHYLDNAIVANETNPEYDISNDNTSFASTINIPRRGKFFDPLSNQYYSQNPNVRRLGDVGIAMNELMEFIYRLRIPSWLLKEHEDLTEEIRTSDNKIKITIPAQTKKTFRLVSKKEGQTIENYIDNYLFVMYSYLRSYSNLKPRDFQILGYVVNMFGLKEYDFTFRINTSMFYGNSASMKSDYWSRPWELFARGFECYMYDLLEVKDRASTYLVSGGLFNHPSGVYPSGTERKILYYLYDRLMQKIKEKFSIANFKPIRDTRVDEYVAFNEESSTEEVEAGIVTDEKDNKVVSKIEPTNELPQKFERLLNMLKAS